MNLETIEQKCLSYLMQVHNPLVPIEQLVRHLRDDEDCPEFEEAHLIEFLREHELFTVIAPPVVEDGVTAELDEMGLPVGVRVILSTRIPAKDELSGLIGANLDTMMDALVGALREAHETGDAEKEAQVRAVLARAERLKGMTRELFEKGV